MKLKPLSLKGSEAGSVAKAGTAFLKKKNTLRFWTVKSGVQRPFVWLRGRFRVASGAPFLAEPNGTIMTAGLFALQPARKTIRPDLIGDGFPFLGEPLRLAGKITLPKKNSRLRLDGVTADAMRLTVDGRNFGWAWQTDGEIWFDAEL